MRLPRSNLIVKELRFAAMAMADRLNFYGSQTLVTENLLGIGSQVDTPRGRRRLGRGAVDYRAPGRYYLSMEGMEWASSLQTAKWATC